MKLNKISKFAALATFLVLGSVTHAEVTVGTFTGSAVGAGLDLQGKFVYALTMNPDAAGTILGDATFTDALATVGATITHANYIQGWYPSSYSGTSDDTALGNVMKSISWTPANGAIDSQVLALSLSGLTVGQSYKAQLLFAEDCCNRGFNFYHDGVKLSSNFSPYSLTGNIVYNPHQSAVLTDTFTATSTSVLFGFGGLSSQYPDNNPILNAATLENVTAVPEPETYALLLTGLGGLGIITRRRKSL